MRPGNTPLANTPPKKNRYSVTQPGTLSNRATDYDTFSRTLD